MGKIYERPSRTLLYEEVVDDLYRQISKKHMQPGDKLPSERELTAELGISRNVLREAFHILESRGIIKSQQGKGRFLRILPQNNPESSTSEDVTRNLEKYSLIDVYTVRQLLEVKVVELVVQNATDEDLSELDQIYQWMKNVFVQTGQTKGEMEMHRSYARKSGNPYLENMLNMVISNILDLMHTRFLDLLQQHETDDALVAHGKIIQALHRRDQEGAKQAMFQHLQATIDMLNKL